MQELPRVLMITESFSKKNEDFLGKLILHINHGIKLVQLREKELVKSEYIALAKNVVEIGRIYDAKIILNTDIETVEKLDADGIHLSSSILMKSYKRPLSAKKIVSAACHDTEQLMHAERIGVDFVTLSPVSQTKTHPNATPLGWVLFSELCKSIGTPVYALGGLAEQDLDIALSYGAYGIAAISSLWSKNYS